MGDFVELNFDGMVGPTHSYSGQSEGNIAAETNRGVISNPQAAAIEGLKKMNFLASLGVPQAVLPPQERPDVMTLRRLGFTGTDQVVLMAAAKQAPELLYACSSASSMWAANIATTTPSIDSMNHKVHFTPANLENKFHRSIESKFTSLVFQTIFRDEVSFDHHEPLPPTNSFGDEGAANHVRLAAGHASKGVHLFVFGRYALSHPDKASKAKPPSRYPARQTYDASTAICRLHQIPPKQTVFARQNPNAIDAGVFHNDVISTGNENLFIYHEAAFANTDAVIDELRAKFKNITGEDPCLYKVNEREFSFQEAVETYLFNSQIVTLPDDTMWLIAPKECERNPRALDVLNKLLSNPDCRICNISFIDLMQSMKNGGGPACLRLRVVLAKDEIARINQNLLLTSELYRELTDWVLRYYRDSLPLKELADPDLLRESQEALERLCQILKLGSIYEFQKA